MGKLWDFFTKNLNQMYWKCPVTLLGNMFQCLHQACFLLPPLFLQMNQCVKHNHLWKPNLHPICRQYLRIQIWFSFCRFRKSGVNAPEMVVLLLFLRHSPLFYDRFKTVWRFRFLRTTHSVAEDKCNKLKETTPVVEDTAEKNREQI